MAQISKPAIPPKLYRNFAIITIATTACLALITSGGSDAADSPSARPTARASTAPRASNTPRYGEAHFRTGSTVEVADGFELYEEYDESFGRGIPSQRNSAAVNAIGASELPANGSENGGFTRAYLASLSDEELDELLRQLRAGGVEDPAVRQQVMAVLEAGGRRRAGRATTTD
ncbi:MAG: hypothetical protein ABIT10_05990 [Alteraurantiacibacter sp.]